MMIKTVEYPALNTAIAALVFSYVVAFFLQIGIRIDFLGKIRFEAITAALLLVMAIFYKTQTRLPKSLLTPYIFILLFFITIQVPLSVKFDISYSTYVDRVIKFAAMALIIAVFVNSPAMVKVFLAGFLLSCLKMGQEGLVGNITGNLVWENQGVMRLHGSTPLYRHPNSFAGMAMGTLPFVYFLYPVVNRYIKWILILLFLLSLHIVIYSASRTAYVALVGMCVYVFIQSKYKTRMLLAFIPILLLASALAPQQYIERFQSIYTGKEAEGNSSQSRIQIMKDAVEIFSSHPLGVGVAAFPVMRERYFGRTQDTHNLYLEVLTNLGIQGFIAFCLFVYALLKSFNLCKRQFDDQIDSLKLMNLKLDNKHFYEIERHKNEMKLFSALCAAFSAYVWVRLFLGFFGMDLYEIYWWLASGFAIALTRMAYISGRITKKLEKIAK